MLTAKIFQSGNSQAVRLPKEFRFNDSEVCIKRIGSAIVLYELNSRWKLLNEAAGEFTDDFMAEGRGGQGEAEQRSPL